MFCWFLLGYSFIIFLSVVQCCDDNSSRINNWTWFDLSRCLLFFCCLCKSLYCFLLDLEWWFLNFLSICCDCQRFASGLLVVTSNIVDAIPKPKLWWNIQLGSRLQTFFVYHTFWHKKRNFHLPLVWCSLCCSYCQIYS